MNIDRCSSLPSFNEYIKKAIKTVKNNKSESKINRILSVVKENKMFLIDDKSNKEEKLRSIKNLNNLLPILDNLESKKLIIKLIKATARSFSHHAKEKNINDSLEAVKALKTIDEDLYYEGIASWINDKKIPIKSLNLSEEEILKIAPRLTYLHLKDGSDSWCKDCSYTEDFIGKILSATKKIKYLKIENCQFKGIAFENFLNTQNLKELSIVNCNNFDKKLPDELCNLESLTLQSCKAFNKPFPKLSNLRFLRFEFCKDFNQALPDVLPNLEQLSFSYCDKFNKKLPQKLPKLEALIFEENLAFNQPLPKELPRLKEIFLNQCHKFNQKFPKKLPQLENCSIACKKFNQKLPEELPSLKVFTVNGAFNQMLPKELPSLENFSASGSFNQALPEKLPNLQSLFLHSKTFNQKLPIEFPNLRKMQLLRCQNFNEKLPDTLPNLRDLSIYSCQSFNQQLPEKLPKLKNISFEKCNIFNQMLPNELPELQTLTARFCYAFNQRLPALPKVKNIHFVGCSDFNRALPDLPNAKYIRFEDCKSYNRKLPKTLPNLVELHFYRCKLFNKELPQSLPKLKNLDIRICEKFNQKLPNALPKLKEISFTNCTDFNQKFPKCLPNLQSLNLNNCDNFNQELPKELPLLKKLEIYNCFGYKPHEHSLSSISQVLKHQPELLEYLTPKMKDTARKNLFKKTGNIKTLANDLKLLRQLVYSFEISNNLCLKYFPQHIDFITLMDLEEVIKKRTLEKEKIKDMFFSFKNQENYLEIVQLAIEIFPILTSYLIQNHRKEIIRSLNKLKVSMEKLPKESQLALMPLLSPNQIKKLIIKKSNKEKEQWLKATIEHKQFLGHTDKVLKEIYRKNLRQTEVDPINRTVFQG